jgi:hypothetical protein
MTDTEAGSGVFAIVEHAVVHRTKGGWRVGGTEMPDLTSAMILADLLSAELSSAEAGSGVPAGAACDASADAPASPGARTDSETGSASAGTGMQTSGHTKDPAHNETSKLRATIGQLEHALAARIRVEQAIGVLAERHRIQPRQAFEQLRTAARSRGRRVIDIASDVVASATNPLLQLPDELSRPHSTRQGRQPRGILGSE